MDGIKKFEDFLDKMQGLLDNARKQGHIIVPIEDLENAFPELKESEGEKIRKELIRFVKGYFPNETSEQRKAYLAWLEKQKTSKEALQYLRDNHSPSEMSDFQAAMNISVAKSYDEGYNEATRRAIEWLRENKDKYLYNTGEKGEYIPACSDMMIYNFKNYMKKE